MFILTTTQRENAVTGHVGGLCDAYRATRKTEFSFGSWRSCRALSGTKQCGEQNVTARQTPAGNGEASADTHLNPSRSRQPIISLST